MLTKLLIKSKDKDTVILVGWENISKDLPVGYTDSDNEPFYCLQENSLLVNIPNTDEIWRLKKNDEISKEDFNGIISLMKKAGARYGDLKHNKNKIIEIII